MNTYKVTDKIKSSKWNAFLLKQDEVEEYLSEGVFVPSTGLFFWFSKAKKENDTRRNKRMIELLNPRVSKISEEYFKHNILKPDKKIISMIIEPTKNLLIGRSVSSIFKRTPKDSDPISIKLQELIDEGKEESGVIVSFYPVSIGEEKKGVFFITTKGICFVVINAGMTSTIAPYAAANAAGPAFGFIAAGIAAVTAKYIAHSTENYKMNKEQQKIIKLAYKYSPCLIAKCFENSQFVPYNIINALIYGKETKEGNILIDLIYQNLNIRAVFEVTQKTISEIVEKLSGDSPPKVNQESLKLE